MNSHLKVVIFLLLIGTGGLFAYKFVLVEKDEETQVSSSDADQVKGRLRIGVDNWVGYLPLCSAEMKRRMRRNGYLLECIDDQADYPTRMDNLRKGELEFAVGTIDSYLINGESVNYPGAIIAVIDESKGGDALVAWRNDLQSIDDLKTKTDIKVAFTPNSPSEHLLKTLSSHFDIPHLRQKRGAWRTESDGSSDALQRLNNKTVSAAVLWEPDVSKALENKNIVKLLGTEDTKNLIVDILLVNRAFSNENTEVVSTLLYNYFRTLKHFRQKPESLESELVKRDKISEEKAQKVLQGVRWVNLTENALSWFGVQQDGLTSRESLIESIESTIDILIESGDMDSSPLPDNNPYRITQRQTIEALFNRGGAFGKKQDTADNNSLTKAFSQLSASAWNGLREVGTLRKRPLTFQSGTASLDEDSQKELDKAAKQLSHYPNFRLIVSGHTGLRGDKAANQQLSQARAEAVANYFTSTFGIDSNRLKAIGFGSEKPLPKKAGESNRAYNYRLPRVELSLVAEEL